MAAKKPTNPFYIAALPVGVLFSITACAYVVMTMQGLDPQRTESVGLVQLMERRGIAIMIGEVALLALLTVAAMATDGFWTRRSQAAKDNQPHI